jgi:uncharacterized membrane protein YidH (DUF202 family)
MSKMNWDPNDWQGRTREQVERNNRVFGYSVIILIIVVAIVLITSIII